MAFNTWRDFENFEAAVKKEYRFIHSREIKEFLGNIKRTLPDRENRLALDTILFRSQIGYNRYEFEGEVVACGFPSERMKPIQNMGPEGRANPKGISYLYLSNDENTSLAEARPHIGQIISLANFRINRDLKVVNCYSVPEYYNYLRCIFN